MPDENDILYNEYGLDFFALLERLLNALFGGGSGGSSWSADGLVESFSNFWTIFTIFSWFLSILLIFGIIYAYIRHNQLKLVEIESLKHQEKLYEEFYYGGTTNNRWQDVEKHIASENPNDWKLAIIEADVMLEELLESKGFVGTAVGEKLKSASPETFTTLDQAWRAHQVRNNIAHGREDFVLTKKIAGETIAQYKMVFDEFGVV